MSPSLFPSQAILYILFSSCHHCHPVSRVRIHLSSATHRRTAFSVFLRRVRRKYRRPVIPTSDIVVTNSAPSSSSLLLLAVGRSKLSIVACGRPIPVISTNGPDTCGRRPESRTPPPQRRVRHHRKKPVFPPLCKTPTNVNTNFIKPHIT